MDIFWVIFWILLIVCVVLYGYTRKVATLNEDGNFKTFQKTYLIVYLLAMGGDWLQGPYVYALYQHYGMTSHQIEVLFVAGFGSSMIFGTIVGSVADKFGRRLNCILYAIFYILSCITKHFPHFSILLVGRFLGGIATSILFSAFESWLICEHHKRGFNDELLGVLFSRATLGNSLVAISAGHIAQTFADHFGYVAPFDISMLVLTLLSVIVYFTWNENYGDSESSISTTFSKATSEILKDKTILLLGLVQSFFEGAMYTFVLEWTPALTPSGADLTEDKPAPIPHGLIFASFMVTVMIGSSLFKILIQIAKVESFMRFVLLLAACSLSIPVLFPNKTTLIFLGFCFFEVCVGIFWPSMGTMRGSYVPESVRSTIMNFFRIPLNLIVIVVLLQCNFGQLSGFNYQNFGQKTIFLCCVSFLLLATIAQHLLYMRSRKIHKTVEYKAVSNESIHSPETV